MADAAPYMAVADTLEREVAEASPGSLVDSEYEVAARFGVHRLTARAALKELERRYLVRRVKGQGTFVAQRLEYRVGPTTPPGWSETVRRAGAQPRAELGRIAHASPPPQVAAELGLPDGAAAWLVPRIRYVNGELVGCADSYLAVETAPDLPQRLVDGASLTATLARVYDAEPVRGSYRAELELPPADIVERLGLIGRPWMLLTHGRTDCRRRGRPLEVSTVWLRADIFRLVVEFGA